MAEPFFDKKLMQVYIYASVLSISFFNILNSNEKEDDAFLPDIRPFFHIFLCFLSSGGLPCLLGPFGHNSSSASKSANRHFVKRIRHSGQALSQYPGRATAAKKIRLTMVNTLMNRMP